MSDYDPEAALRIYEESTRFLAPYTAPYGYPKKPAFSGTMSDYLDREAALRIYEESTRFLAPYTAPYGYPKKPTFKCVKKLSWDDWRYGNALRNGQTPIICEERKKRRKRHR